MKWRLELFGQFRLVSPDGIPASSKSERFKLLLAYLGLLEGNSCPRKLLADRLFVDQDIPSDANFSLLLNRVTSSLVKYSPLPLLSVQRDRIGLVQENVSIDCQEFERAFKLATSETDPLKRGTSLFDALKGFSGKVVPDIDDPLLLKLKTRVQRLGLATIAELASGPLGDQYRVFLLDKLDQLDAKTLLDPLSVEHVLMTYAGLRLKENLVQTFTDFEVALDEEYGESPRRELVDLFEKLLASLEAPRTANPLFEQPARPSFTVGRDGLLDAVAQSLGSAQSSDRLFLVAGQSGIGKSHFIKELFWRTKGSIESAYIDLERVPSQLVGKLIESSNALVFFVDHAEKEEAEFIPRLLELHSEIKFVCTGYRRTGYKYENLIVLPPLELGTSERQGTAVTLLSKHLSVSQARLGADEDIVKKSLIELAELCDGIPLALEVAAKLGASIGLEATISSLKRDLRGLAVSREDDRHRSVESAIRSSFHHLDEAPRDIVTLLSLIELPFPSDTLLSRLDYFPNDLDDALSSGLVIVDPFHKSIRVLRSTALFVKEAVDPEVAEALFTQLCEAVALWFVDKSKQFPIDLRHADFLPLAMRVVNELHFREREDSSLSLIAGLKPWIGSQILSDQGVEGIARVVKDESLTDLREWPGAVLTLGAAYFHHGQWQQMHDLLIWACASESFEGFDETRKCYLTMQAGLAKRVVGDINGALETYRKAIDLAHAAKAEGILVQCYYNLGASLETAERLEEALSAFESASRHFVVDVDPRLESIVKMSIGRMRHRLNRPLGEIQAILESTLVHALQKNDKRISAEIVQNLGLIYYERGFFVRACFAEVIGTSLLLDFGYTNEFRRLTKSSMVTLCAGLYELGMNDLAMSARVLIDKLGTEDLYPANVPILKKVEERSYVVSDLPSSIASQSELSDFLHRCYKSLRQRYPEDDGLNLIDLVSDPGKLGLIEEEEL